MQTDYRLFGLAILLTILITLYGCESNSANKQNPETGTSETANEVVRMVFWNVESEGADPQVIAEQIKQLSSADIFAFCEVAPQDAEMFRLACGENFVGEPTRTGNMDRLLIVYDSSRFDMIRRFELDDINFENRYRSPLVVHLKDKATGVEFLVMTNHLARGKSEVRQEQAAKLVEWARDQELPVIAIGDFNFDFEFATEKGNPAFDVFLRDNIWKWVRPEKLVDSNWYDPEGDGEDDFPGSILDFAFLAGPAKAWKASCMVIERDGDFPDDEKTSDHRPIELRIELPAKN